MDKIQVVRIDPEWMRCICPFHNDQKPSLFVNLEKDFAHCFAGCYSGDLTGLISRFTGENRIISRLKLPEMFAFNIEDRRFQYSADSSDFVDARDWFQKQGFTFKTAYYWKIEFNRISFTLPMKDFQNNLCGYATRNLIGGDKYIYSKGFKKDILFGENFLDIYSPVIVVEGILDELWFWQNSLNSVALLGTTATAKQLEKLTLLDIRGGIFDDDAAGNLAIEKYSKLFPKAIFKATNKIRLLNKEQIEEVLCQKYCQV